MIAMHERIDWLTAPPLWTPGPAGQHELARPALLRYHGDDFMEQYAAAVAGGDGAPAFQDAVAAQESWDDPRAGMAHSSATSDETIKLFQPVHGRFYLVSAGLVCGRYGLPDKAIGPSESASFVLRRLVQRNGTPIDPDDPETHYEYGYVTNGAGEGWALAPAKGLLAAEERLALFPTTTRQRGRRRRVLSGLVPVSAAERYESAPLVQPDVELPVVGGTPSSADLLSGIETVVSGLQALGREVRGLDTGAGNPTTRRFRHALFFLLLDLHDWLALDPAARQHAGFTLATATFEGASTWIDAADDAAASYGLLETVDEESDPPAPVGSMTVAAMQSALDDAGVDIGAPGVPVVAARPDESPLFASMAEAADVANAPAPDPSELPPPGDHVYVARCVYDRPDCRPSQRLVVSEPTRPFALAGFHDIEAPARPVIIPTPSDVTVEGFRNFPKTVSIAISKQLRAQMDRVRGITFDNFEDGIPDEQTPSSGVGMICSLSIPIITICALILLMIMVQILNIVFFWLPYFQVCRPEVES